MLGEPLLGSMVKYSDAAGCALWEGRQVDDRVGFERFVREVVRPHLADAESSFESDLRGLATTGMAIDFVERLLTAVPTPEDWEIGEALAVCALQMDSGREIYWPWNSVRDRRTPRASLPGADLVGFCRQDETVLLLFGEVKTSGDKNSPPKVMYGGSGMTWQLQQIATRLEIQHTLLEWLCVRCQSQPYRALYTEAVGRYLKSAGKELLLVGVLIRDTLPNELDFKSRGEALSKRFGSPTRIELIAWYLPIPISEWPRLLQEMAP